MTEPSPTGMGAAGAPTTAVVDIQRIAAGGAGVGRWPDGRTVFVPRTAPGDRAVVTERASKRRHVSGKLERLLNPGPDRVVPACEHYLGHGCGGCQLQHLNQSSQLEAKRAIVGDALRRIGGLDVPDPEIVPGDPAWGYRNKLVLHVDQGRIGFHPYDAPRATFDLVCCAIAAPRLQVVWARLTAHRALLPEHTARLVLKVDRHGATHVVAQVGRGHQSAWPDAERLARHLEAGGQPTSLWVAKRGGRPVQVAGPPARPEVMAFEQVHAGLGQRVRRDALAWLGPLGGGPVWDLYAGAGETSVLLAEAGATVEAVERDRVAVQAGRRRCRDLPVRWHAGLVEAVVPRLGAATHAVLNPPRVGVDCGVIEALRSDGPGRMVYISCDPATLARDLARLLAPGGRDYELSAVGAYDLFPQTAHVETVVLLERR